jgi:hypothetical protein
MNMRKAISGKLPEPPFPQLVQARLLLDLKAVVVRPHLPATQFSGLGSESGHGDV